MILLRPQSVPTVKVLFGTHHTTELTSEVMIKSSVYVRKKHLLVQLKRHIIEPFLHFAGKYILAMFLSRRISVL